jgi:uncharacterized membrane-anchored protein YjiN (DUF445 family)
MPDPTPLPTDDVERGQTARLKRMQAVAGALLLAAAGLWLLARYMTPQGGAAWGYLRAFAEAAMIGGLADWFAVVALFRRPLGLPIWHTAILPTRKDDVARSLGQFVEGHLVTPQALREHVPNARLAARLAEALQRQDAADATAGWLAKLAPRALAGVDDAHVAAWLAARVQAALQQLDGPALSLRAAERLVAEGTHQRLVDGVARGVSDYLADPEHLPAISDFLAQAMNIDNPMVKSMLKAAAPKAAQGLVGVLDELQARPDHPWRLQFDRWAAEWLAQAATSKVWDARVRQWQHELVGAASTQAWIAGLWPGIKTQLQTRLDTDAGQFTPFLARMVQALGQHLASDPELRARLDATLADAAATLASEHRGAAARFLEHQLGRWSGEQMSEKVELAIGRDLQFIRVNGTLVGGLIGLALHALAQL